MTQTEGLNRGKKPAAGLSGEQAFIFLSEPDPGP